MPVAQAVRLAADNGFHGLELRAHPEEPVHPGIGGDERARVAAQFAAAGVVVLAVAGYVRVAAPGGPEDDGPVLADGRALLELAHDLGAPFVRVFPGGAEDDPAGSDAAAARRLAALAPIAADLGVRVLLETHDSHRTGADAARVLTAVGHASVGALWDVLHTWRGGEEPGTTHRLLAPHLGYVQVKDVASGADATPLPPGVGVLPLARVVGLLARAGDEGDPVAALGSPAGASASASAHADTAAGWLCWEYEKRWYPEVPELPGLLPGVAEHLRGLLDRR